MSAVNRLSAFYAGIKKSKVRTFIAVIAVYTILFALFFLKAAGQTLSDKGHLLGSDGVLQYLPFLVQLRRDLLTFFGSIASGAPALPMVDLNYAFGADTITATAPDFIPMLPYYIFSVFLPENAMPAFITGGVVLMSYLSGLSFTAMCVHFGKDPLFSAVFAPVYVFCADYWLSTWGNPHFLCPFAVFPLMIIGIDRIIQGKSGIMFALAVAFPALGGVHLLVYSMPFVVIFAAIRVYYVHKGAYFRSLGKYFLIGLLYTLLGVMLAAAAFLPFINSLLSSARSLGNAGLTVADLFTPDFGRFSKMLSGRTGETFCYGTWLAAIPLFLYSLTRHSGRNELRAYSIAALVLMLLPVTSYATNGFQYLLCRWGFAPGALMAYICVEYVPVLLKPKKGDTAFMVFICVAYILSVTLEPGFSGVIPLLVIIAVCVITPLRKPVAKAVDKFAAILRNIPAKLKSKDRYGAVLLIVVMAVIMAVAIIIVTAAKLYKYIPIVIFAGLMPIAAVVTAKFTKKVLPSALIVAVLFAVTGLVYDNGIVPASVYRAEPQVKALYKTLSEHSGDPDEAGRYCSIGNIADSIFPSENTEKKDILARVAAMLENGDSKYCDGIPLIYDLPTAEIFNSTINGSYMKFLDRTGMDGLCITSPGHIWAYSGKEVMYSLFGVKNMYTTEKCPYIFGAEQYKELPLEGFDTYYIYDNRYALPLGVTYDKTMSADRYAGFNSAELPYAMMNEVWLDGYNGGISDEDLTYSKKCDFSLEKIYRGTTGVGIDSFDNRITINDSTKGCFLYISFDGVRSGSEFALVGYAEDFFVDMDNGMTHAFKIFNPLFGSPWKYTADHYTLTLGYCEDDVKELNFVSPFEYETVKLYTVPAEVYTDGYERICTETLCNVKTGINTITGEIEVSADKILSVDLLYNGGWEAYIDGVKAPVYKANGLFLGIPLSAGHHEVKLIYHTPLIYEGLILSCAGVLIIVMIIIFRRKRQKKGNTAI